MIQDRDLAHLCLRVQPEVEGVVRREGALGARVPLAENHVRHLEHTLHTLLFTLLDRE